MNQHKIHSKDDDVCCRWLCLSAGRMSRADEAELSRALQELGAGRIVRQVPYVDMLGRVD